VVKIKKDLIHKAKVKKSYAKLKARMPIEETDSMASILEQPTSEPSHELHPERQAMLDAPREPTPPPGFDSQQRHRERRSKRPKYFEKEQAFAEQQKAEAEARRADFERRNRERRQKIEERERFRKAMAKARTGGRNGQRKLGRESKILLERVKRIVGD
jgi:C4-dicarboxylate-specific signal transduction histidine kinase